MNRVVIVGASLAGVSAADELRVRGFQGEITLIGAETHLPYNRPPLSKQALASAISGTVWDDDGLALRPQGWYEDHGVTLRLGSAATALDVEGRTVCLADGAILDYDGLVIATGSQLRRLALVRDLPAAHELRTKDDAVRLADSLRKCGHLVVVGAGFIGMEVAATARSLGNEVTVIDVAATPMSRVLGSELGDWFRRRHEHEGVRVQCSSGVAAFVPEGGRTRVNLVDGAEILADTLLVGIGTEPATEWLRSSSLRLNDGVICYSTLQAAHGVVAAGDVARWSGKSGSTRIEHWTNAVEQGVHAAATLLGDAREFEHLPTLWTDQYDAKARCIGLPSSEDEVQILEQSDTSLVAVFAQHGRLTAALCVNAPRRLASLRQAVVDRMPLSELLSDR